MIVYRITKSTHSSDISGTGAALFPGRWNKKGTPVLYTGQSPEIALLEIIVNTPPMIVPDLDILTIEIPNNSILDLKASDLPANWFNYPAPTILSEIGQHWVNEGKSLALKIPSCIIQSSYNYILNCQHPDYYTEVKVINTIEFLIDKRLFK